MPTNNLLQPNFPKTKKARINQILRRISAPGSYRALRFLSEHPGAFTDEIARNCYIGNVSHAFRSIREILQSYGLQVVCELPKPVRVNEAGQRLQFHQWWVVNINLP